MQFNLKYFQQEKAIFYASILMCLIITIFSSYKIYLSLNSPLMIGADDANITQVYARNIGSGFGYVYTPGNEHVEGSTSLLWTILSAICFRLTPSLESTQLVLCLALTTMTLASCLQVVRNLATTPGAALSNTVIALAWFICLPAFFYWGVLSLMDTALWACTFTGLIACLARDLAGVGRGFRRWASLWSLLAVLARPEAAALVPAALIVGCGVKIATTSWRSAITAYRAPVLVAVAAIVIGMLGRYAYFGYPFPNTYYAKVSTNPADNLISGLVYLKNQLTDPVIYIGMAAMAFCIARHGLEVGRCMLTTGRNLPVRPGVEFFVAAVLAAAFGSQVLIGGDHFGHFRVFQPFIPLLIVPLAGPVSGLWRALGPRAPLLAAVLLFIPFAAERYLGFDTGLVRGEIEIAIAGRKIGRTLAFIHDARPQTSLGVSKAGGVALTYPGRVEDLLGLNWVAMAHASGRRQGIRGHSAFNKSVFWEYPPDIFDPEFVGHLDPDRPYRVNEFARVWFLNLYDDPDFRAAYGPVIVSGPDGDVFAFMTVKLLADLAGDARVKPMSWRNIEEVR